MLSREEYRKIKSFSKEQMDSWLARQYNVTYNQLRKEFNAAYKDEVDSSICNFLITLWYTLHYNEDTNLQKDELSSFMQDMYVTVDYFRSGEYKPEDYENQMKEDGIQFEKFDYDKLYRELKEKYDAIVLEKQEIINKAKQFLTVSGDALKYSLTQEEIKKLKNILEGVE